MTLNRSSRLLLVALAAVAAAASPRLSAAQSLLGFRGLGVPVLAVGSRVATTGNLGIGLAGVELSATDPSAGAGSVFPTISVSMQSAWGEFDLDDQSGSSATTRFPLLAVGYPVRTVRGNVTLLLAGHMEQRWASETLRTAVLGGKDVVVDDRLESDGGTSLVRIGWAQRLGDRFAVGASAGAFMGKLERRWERTLDSLALGQGVEPFSLRGSRRYSGPAASIGFSADPHRLIHLGAAVEWSGDLEALPEGETSGDTRSFDIPTRILVGATGLLTQRLHVNASLAYQDWSGADGFDAGTTADGAVSWGTGLEWRAVTGETRSFPLRLGYRRLALPFKFGSADPVESIWSGGLGFNLDQVEDVRFGWIDVGVERASRSSAPLVERFWRITVSAGISRL